MSISDNSDHSVKVKLIQKKVKPKGKLSVTIPSISNIAALLMKNWITMKRNLLLLLFVFFLPGIVLLINSVAIGQSPNNLPLALLNQESDCNDTYFITSCEANMLGCYFKEALNKSNTVNLVTYHHREEAFKLAEQAVVRGVIVIPANFSTSFLKRVLSDWRYAEFLYYYGIEDEEHIGKFDKIDISLDMSDPQLALFIKNAITKAMDDFTKHVSAVCEDHLGDGIDLSMISIGDPTLGYEETDFREFITPGMIALAIFFLAMALTSESFIAERSQGLLERSWITGVLPVEIMASYILSQFVVMVVQVFILYFMLRIIFFFFQAAITLITVFLIFQLPCHGPVTCIIVITLFQGW